MIVCFYQRLLFVNAMCRELYCNFAVLNNDNKTDSIQFSVCLHVFWWITSQQPNITLRCGKGWASFSFFAAHPTSFFACASALNCPRQMRGLRFAWCWRIISQVRQFTAIKLKAINLWSWQVHISQQWTILRTSQVICYFSLLDMTLMNIQSSHILPLHTVWSLNTKESLTFYYWNSMQKDKEQRGDKGKNKELYERPRSRRWESKRLEGQGEKKGKWEKRKREKWCNNTQMSGVVRDKPITRQKENKD